MARFFFGPIKKAALLCIIESGKNFFEAKVTRVTLVYTKEIVACSYVIRECHLRTLRKNFFKKSTKKSPRQIVPGFKKSGGPDFFATKCCGETFFSGYGADYVPLRESIIIPCCCKSLQARSNLAEFCLTRSWVTECFRAASRNVIPAISRSYAIETDLSVSFVSRTARWNSALVIAIVIFLHILIWLLFLRNLSWCPPLLF